MTDSKGSLNLCTCTGNVLYRGFMHLCTRCEKPCGPTSAITGDSLIQRLQNLGERNHGVLPAGEAIAIVRDHIRDTAEMVKPLSNGDKHRLSQPLIDAVDVLHNAGCLIQNLASDGNSNVWASLRRIEAAIAALRDFMAIPPLGLPGGKSTAAVGMAAAMGEYTYQILIGDSGKVALIDLADNWLETYSWSLDSHGYARRRTPEGWVYMHTDILGSKECMTPDHINRDPLDNRRSNLRFVTRGQNVVNSPKANSANPTSKYKGVSWDKERKKWVSSICVSDKRTKLGRFANEDDAAVAYNEAAVKYFGEAAFLNTVSDSGMVGGLDASTRKDEESAGTPGITTTASTVLTSPTKKGGAGINTSTVSESAVGIAPITNKAAPASPTNSSPEPVLILPTLGTIPPHAPANSSDVTTDYHNRLNHDKNAMADGRPIFGENSPHDIERHLDKVCASDAPVFPGCSTGGPISRFLTGELKPVPVNDVTKQQASDASVRFDPTWEDYAMLRQENKVLSEMMETLVGENQNFMKTRPSKQSSDDVIGHFRALWNHYTPIPDEKLTKGAIELKRRLLSTVEGFWCEIPLPSDEQLVITMLSACDGLERLSACIIAAFQSVKPYLRATMPVSVSLGGFTRDMLDNLNRHDLEEEEAIQCTLDKHGVKYE